MCLFVGVTCLAQQTDPIKVPDSNGQGIVRLQMLARVGGSSVSTRSLYLFSCVKNPSACKAYTSFVASDSGKQLQEYLLVKMAFEDNAIFKTVRFSDLELTKKVLAFQKSHPNIWRKLKSEVQVQEVELRSVVEEMAVFEALLAKQESLETWIQQLRTRYKVQLFNQNAT